MIAVLEVEEEPLEVVTSDNVPLLDSEDGDWKAHKSIEPTSLEYLNKIN